MDAAELEYQSVAAEDDVVADGNVSGQRSVVGENSVVADNAIVSQVAVGHNPIAVSDTGFADAGYSAEVESGEFANGIVVADNQAGWFALVFLILRYGSEAGKLENTVVFADGGVPIDDGMRADFGTGTDLCVRPDNGVGTNFNTAVQLGLWVDDCSGMDEGHGNSLWRGVQQPVVFAAR